VGELSELAAVAEAWQAQGLPVALATVVAARGSAYRREGAKMLLGPDGKMQGTVSGGCVEPELVAIADQVGAQMSGRTVDFNLAEDTMWGLGIGCGGEIRVRVCTLDPILPATWRRIETAAEAFVTVQPLEGPGSVVVGPGEEGPAVGDLGHPALTAAAVEVARRRLAGVRTGIEEVAGRSLFFDVMAPPPLLVLFGAGHDALPLSELAQRVGFRVRVVDSRPAYANQGRFPGAEVVLADVRQPDEARDVVPAGAYAVVMHHHLERDTAALSRLAQAQPRYVGALGPRSRTDRMVGDVAAQGVDVASLREALASPVGLDVGAEGADAIAVAIVGELLALRAGREGGRLATADGTIHAR